MQHQFFQQFGVPQQQAPQYSQETLINTMILEIGNNWPYARWLMDRHRNGEIKQVDPLENDWLQFILGNNIDIESFANAEEFINKLSK